MVSKACLLYIIMCCMTVQPGMWWRRADQTGVVQDDSCYSRCGL